MAVNPGRSRPAVIVVDASIVFKWFVREPHSDAALDLLRDGDLIAPDLVIVEVASAAWKVAGRGAISTEQAIAFAEAVPDFFSELVASRVLLPRAIELAIELRHPVYDAMYIALALQSETHCVTADERLLRKTRRTRFANVVRPLRASKLAAEKPA